MNVLFCTVVLCLVTAGCCFKAPFSPCGRFFAHKVAPTLRTTRPTFLSSPSSQAKNALIALGGGKWSTNEFERLEEAVTMFGDAKHRWDKVAEHVGGTRTERACKLKWYARSNEQWSESEAATLRELVGDNNLKEVDWLAVSQKVGHTLQDCKGKLKSLVAISERRRLRDDKKAQKEPRKVTKSGFFLAEEDSLILQRVREWSSEKKGVWSSIDKELRRGGGSARDRFQRLQDKPQIGVIERFHSTTAFDKGAWNETLDARLQEGMSLVGGSRGAWGAVAEHVGHGKSTSACRNRWTKIGMNGHYYPNKAWSDKEVNKLCALVVEGKQQIKHAHTANNSVRLDWKAIGQELGRQPMECQSKWQNVEYDTKGRFTSDEDALILQRVEEWGEKGPGLWTSLAKELGRNGLIIRARWLCLRVGVPRTTVWTDEMDAALLVALGTVLKTWKSIRGGPRLWSEVTVLMVSQGWSVNSAQCNNRYNAYLKFKEAGLRTEVEWTPELVVSLMELREEGHKWPAISAELKIAPKVCSAKHRTEFGKSLKHGPFTAEEDSLIRQRVAESGGNPSSLNAFWPALQREMGRPYWLLWRRWFRTMCHKK